MARRPRNYRPDLVYELTCNVNKDQFFLRPGDASNEIVAGVFGRAQEHYPAVRLHALNPLSTHLTALLSSSSPLQLRFFITFIKTNIARELKRLHALGESTDFWERRRARMIPIAPDPASLEARFRYCLSQGTKENLVMTPYDWSGVTGVHALAMGVPLKGWWYDRTKEGQARGRGKTFDKRAFATEYEVRFSPLPHWRGMDESEWQRRAKAIVDDIAREAIARRGDKVLGTDAIEAMPLTHQSEGPIRSPAPICHAVGKQAFHALRAEIVAFCEAYSVASESERHGDGSIPFPPFSFPPPPQMTSGDDFVSDLPFDSLSYG